MICREVNELGVKERIVSYGLHLRWERKFDEATRLEDLLSDLINRQGILWFKIDPFYWSRLMTLF